MEYMTMPDQDSNSNLSGLNSEEAAARLARFGKNEPAATRHNSVLRELLHSLTNPLVLILIGAATLSGFLGDAADAAIIAIIVLLSTVIDLVQTHPSPEAARETPAQ